MITKTCNVCQLTKTLDQFHKNKKARDGHQSECKTCVQTRAASNKDKMAAYRQTQRGRYAKYKGSAKERGLTFDLTMEDFMTFWQGDCTYCGDQIATVGIDRLDSNVGYTLANCIPCCWECNRIKGDRSSEALNTHLLKMLKHQEII